MKQLIQRNLFFIVICAVFIALQIFHFTQFIMISPDSKEYLQVSQSPLLSSAFWCAIRAPIYPLFLKLFHSNVTVVMYAQLILSIIAWIFFAFALSSQFKSGAARVIAAVSILGLGSVPSYTGWNGCILSEALSVVLFLFGFGLWLFCKNKKSIRFIAVFSFIIFSFVMVRDTHSYFILGMAALFLIAYKFKPAVIASFLASVLLFLISSYSAFEGHRHWVPLVDTIGYKILTNPEATEFFKVRGMPLNENTEKFKGKFAAFGDYSVFQPWLAENAKTVYAQWLIHDFKNTFIKPLWRENIFEIWGVKLNQYRGEQFELKFTEKILEKVFYPTSKYIMSLWFLCIFGFSYFAVRFRSIPELLWPVLFFWILAWPQAVLIWAGDPMEIGRHGLIVSLQNKLGIVMVLSCLIDHWKVKNEK